MNAVFLDTVGLLALWDVRDQWHALAEQAFAEITRDQSRLVTTTFILLECGNAAARRPYRQEVNSLRLKLASRGELVVPTAEDWEQAWIAYDRGDAAYAGIVDCISFVVMRRLGLTRAFTGNAHFRAAGFETLF